MRAGHLVPAPVDLVLLGLWLVTRQNLDEAEGGPQAAVGRLLVRFDPGTRVHDAPGWRGRMPASAGQAAALVFGGVHASYERVGHRQVRCRPTGSPSGVGSLGTVAKPASTPLLAAHDSPGSRFRLVLSARSGHHEIRWPLEGLYGQRLPCLASQTLRRWPGIVRCRGSDRRGGRDRPVLREDRKTRAGRPSGRSHAVGHRPDRLLPVLGRGGDQLSWRLAATILRVATAA